MPQLEPGTPVLAQLERVGRARKGALVVRVARRGLRAARVARVGRAELGLKAVLEARVPRVALRGRAEPAHPVRKEAPQARPELEPQGALVPWAGAAAQQVSELRAVVAGRAVRPVVAAGPEAALALGP